MGGRFRWRDVVRLMAYWAVAYGLIWLVVWRVIVWNESWFIGNEDQLSTLLQVIPSAVVAVFVFAAGTLFVIAQMIQSTLGSRAVLVLLDHGRARSGVVIGILLLVVSLVLAMIQHAGDDKPFWPWDEPALSRRVQAAAVALSVATVFYVFTAVGALLEVARTFVDPAAYGRTLSSKIRGTGIAASDDAYRQVRVLRQWLRTAAANGESRDLTHALTGLKRLLRVYATRSSEEGLLWREAPSEYITSHEDVLRQGEPSVSTPLSPGWFGNEVGRAVVRALEVGIRGDTLLPRDADGMLQALVDCTEFCLSREKRPLAEEAGFLMDRIAEIAMLRTTIDAPVWREWLQRPVRRLAVLEGWCEEKGRGDGWAAGHPDEPDCLRPLQRVRPEKYWSTQERYPVTARALAAWCLSQYPPPFPPTSTAIGGDLLGPTARREDPRLWFMAEIIVQSPEMWPRWSSGDLKAEEFANVSREAVARVRRLRSMIVPPAPTSR